MDRYAYVLRIMDTAHEYSKDLATSLEQLASAKNIYQRLVSTYGKERVSSSTKSDSPVLASLIRQENSIEALENQVLECEQAIKKASRLISLLQSRTYRQILTAHCTLGWSHGRIAKSRACATSTVKRKYSDAIRIIANELNKKEAGA